MTTKMTWLEVRRHSHTKKGEGRGKGSDLSQEGVELARRIGSEIRAPVTYVVASTAPRTAETAIAMGFAVDAIVEVGYSYIDGVMTRHEQWEWEQPFVRYRELTASSREMAAFVDTELRTWTAALERAGDGETALVVSHGGLIEPVLVACAPGAEHASWGGAMSHGDGARLCFVDGRCTSVEIRRAISPVTGPPAGRA